MKKILILLILFCTSQGYAQVWSIKHGGTGATTAAGALKKIAPDTANNHDKFLRGDLTWATPSGGGGGTQICEIPSGVENDTNKVFILSHTPVSDTTTDLEIYFDGQHQNPFTHAGWSAPDYVVTGDTITLSRAPSSTDIILARYRY